MSIVPKFVDWPSPPCVWYPSLCRSDEAIRNKQASTINTSARKQRRFSTKAEEIGHKATENEGERVSTQSFHLDPRDQFFRSRSRKSRRVFRPATRRRGLYKPDSNSNSIISHRRSRSLPCSSIMASKSSCALLILAATVALLLLGASDARIQSKILRGDLGEFRVNLVHPSTSINSSSRAEKIRTLVARSNARVEFLAKKLMNQKKNQKSADELGASPQDFQSPLSPNGGGYIMEFSVGTPAQKFKAIADTGSDLVWVQSDPCSSCSGTIFHPGSSSTYHSVDCDSSLCQDLPESSCGSGSSCRYLYEYGSGGTEGVFGKDTVGLGSQRFPSFAVGCGNQNDGFDGVDGLVGLGQGPISLTSQLSSQIAEKFSYCLVDINNPSASSPLFFGNSAKLSGSGIQSTPILPSNEYPTYYLISVTGISVAGSSIGSPDTTIIDSGTTLTYIPDSIYRKLLSKFESLITLPKADGSQVGLDLCYDTSSHKNYKFPSLTLNLKGATLTPPSSNYFLAVDDSGDTVCLAMGSATGLPVSIVGNVMQQGYHILYDRGSSTLSFVKENCESLN